MAPEVVDGSMYQLKPDICSLGVIFWRMATGTPKEDARHMPSDILSSLDPRVQGLLQLCLQTSPEARPTAQELVDWIDNGKVTSRYDSYEERSAAGSSSAEKIHLQEPSTEMTLRALIAEQQALIAKQQADITRLKIMQK